MGRIRQRDHDSFLALVPLCDAIHFILLKEFGVCAVEGAEDPERILDQAVTDMNNDLIKLRQATAKVRAYIAGRSLCVFRLPMR